MRQSLTAAMGVTLSRVQKENRALVLSQRKSAVHLLRGKTVPEEANFHSAKRLRVGIAMMKHLPLHRNIN